MPYMIETWDKPDAQGLRDSARPAHLAFLDANAHRLLACGAKLTDDGARGIGSLYLLDTEDRAEAEAFVAADPFSAAGLFETVAVTRWRKAFFDFRNCLG